MLLLFVNKLTLKQNLTRPNCTITSLSYLKFINWHNETPSSSKDVEPWNEIVLKERKIPSAGNADFSYIPPTHT